MIVRYVLLIFGIGSSISIEISEYRVLCLKAVKQAASGRPDPSEAATLNRQKSRYSGGRSASWESRSVDREAVKSLKLVPRHSMGLPYMPISWGGARGVQCRHIWHTWSVWVWVFRAKVFNLIDIDESTIGGGCESRVYMTSHPRYASKPLRGECSPVDFQEFPGVRHTAEHQSISKHACHLQRQRRENTL